MIEVRRSSTIPTAYDRRGADGTVHFVGFSAVPGPQYTVQCYSLAICHATPPTASQPRSIRTRAAHDRNVTDAVSTRCFEPLKYEYEY